ncbi:MAG: hypothetical protein B6241_11035 [Spirochaetaceae bacterium 4572_59]|nr:MAG: hypothetical protein B6241_11035 [Spirochaetaceae bacterium 4572_59]
MMKKILIPLLIFATVFTLCAADFRLLSFADYYGRIEPGESYDSLRTRFYIQPELQTSLFNFDLTLSANLWYQGVGDEDFIATDNILREAYISFPLGDFDVALGQKFETFGFADLYSPLNVINGSDPTIYSLDDAVDGKRADAMIQIQFYPNFDDTIELIYVPFPRPDYIAKGEVELDNGTNRVILNFNEEAYLTDPAHSIFMRYYHFSSNFDLQLIYACYVEQSPGFDLEKLDSNSPLLTGTGKTVYTRNNLFGIGVSTPLGETILSEDFAFTMTEDSNGSDMGIKNSRITANTQFTRSILNGTFAQLNVIYQYILNYDNFKGDYDDPVYSDLSEEINDYFVQPQQHIAFAVLHLHKAFLREKLFLALNTAYIHPEVYIAPRISYALSDRLMVESGADIFTSEPSDNDLVRSNQYDNFFIRIKYEY